MKYRMLFCAALAVAGLTLCNGGADAQQLVAQFSGFDELGPLAIYSPTGEGTLTLNLDKTTQTLDFKLTYSGLTSAVTQSHIHFGKARDLGGIIVFLCSNLGNGPAGTQACPADGGTVTGVITAASVLALPGQNVPARSFDALVAALLSNTAYGNIHTVNFPSGEIRGQVLPAENDND